jgi:hypothetical protein
MLEGDLGLVTEARRRLVRLTSALQLRVHDVDGDRRDPARRAHSPGPRSGLTRHGHGVDPEELRKHTRSPASHLHADRVVRERLRRVRQLGSAPAVLTEVLGGENAGLAGAIGQGLRGGERRCVGRGLRGALLAIPGADVEHHRNGAEQADEEEDGKDGRLAGFTAKTGHSTRSVVSDLRSPAAKTNPNRSIS